MASPWRAVVGVKLEESLRLQSRACGETGFGEEAGHVVRLRRELVKAQLFAHLLPYSLVVGTPGLTVGHEDVDSDMCDGFLGEHPASSPLPSAVVRREGVAHKGHQRLYARHLGEGTPPERSLHDERGELEEAILGETRGASSRPTERTLRKRRQAILMGEEGIFSLPLLAERFVGEVVEEACRAEEERLDLRELVAMLEEEMQGQGEGQALHRIAIEPEAQRTEEECIEGLSPVTFTPLEELTHGRDLAREAATRETGEPHTALFFGDGCEVICAGELCLCGEEGGSLGAKLFGHHQETSRQYLTRGEDDRAIVLLDDVEDDGSVGGVGIVMMLVPLARGVVDLHRPHPEEVIDPHLGGEEVWTSMHIEYPRVKNLNASTCQSALRDQLRIAAVCPYIM